MTPNVASVSSGPGRRSCLASTVVAAAAVAGGMPLLTACGESDSGSHEGATSGKAADKLLPTYVASTIAKPDLPSKNGSSAGYISEVDLAALASPVPGKVGTGAPLKIMSPHQDGNTYGEKLGAVLAFSSIPDKVSCPAGIWSA